MTKGNKIDEKSKSVLGKQIYRGDNESSFESLLTCELGFLLEILQVSSRTFEFKTWFQFWESQPGSEPAKVASLKAKWGATGSRARSKKRPVNNMWFNCCWGGVQVSIQRKKTEEISLDVLKKIMEKKKIMK